MSEKKEKKRKKSKISGKIGKFGLKKVIVRGQNAKNIFFLINTKFSNFMNFSDFS
jgi:hypothetical protein